MRTPETWDEEGTGTPVLTTETPWELIRQEDQWRARALYTGYEEGEREDPPRNLFPNTTFLTPTSTERRTEPTPWGSDTVLTVYGRPLATTGQWNQATRPTHHTFVEGDHAWMYFMSEGHQNIHWTACYTDQCLYHLPQKAENRWLPRRHYHEAVPKPHSAAELTHWVPWDRNNRWIALIPDPLYPLSCTVGRSTVADCPTNTCHVHAPEKARQLNQLRLAMDTPWETDPEAGNATGPHYD